MTPRRDEPCRPAAGVGAGLVRAAVRALAALGLWAAGLAGAWAQPVTVRFEADLRAEAAAGRFDPARDRVELRGGFPPLAWDRGLALAPRGDGRWEAEVRFERRPAGGQPVPHKFRIVRAGLVPDEGWEPGANHPALLEGAAPSVARLRPRTPTPRWCWKSAA